MTFDANLPPREALLKHVFGNKRRLIVLGQLARQAAEHPGVQFSQKGIAEELAEKGDSCPQGLLSQEILALERHGLVTRSREWEDRGSQFTLVEGPAESKFWGAIGQLMEAVDELPLTPKRK